MDWITELNYIENNERLNMINNCSKFDELATKIDFSDLKNNCIAEFCNDHEKDTIKTKSLLSAINVTFKLSRIDKNIPIYIITKNHNYSIIYFYFVGTYQEIEKKLTDLIKK